MLITQLVIHRKPMGAKGHIRETSDHKKKIFAMIRISVREFMLSTSDLF